MNTILTYKEWVDSNLDELYGVDDPRKAYLTYITDNALLNYSQSSKDDVADIKRDNLITFLLELGYRGKETDTATLIRSIDFSNDADIEIAIPQYATILADISKYISSVRPQVSTSSDEIALASSKSGILGVLSAQIRSLLIDSGYDTSFSIDFDHYYDDNIYFDKEIDTGMPINDMGVIANSPSNPDLVEPAGDDKAEYIDYDVDGVSNNEYAGKISDKYISTSFFTTNDDGDIIEYNTADLPSSNLSNMYYPTIAIRAKDNQLYTKDDVGKYFIPNKMGMSTFIGNGGRQYDSRLDTIFPNSEFRTDGYGYTGVYQDSAVINSSSFAWMDIVGISWGDVLSDYAEYQRMVPYQSDVDTNRKTLHGVVRSDANLDPWSGALDNQWSDIYTEYVEYRGIYDNRNWYADLGASRGVVTDYGSDFMGNDIGLFKTIFQQSIKDRECDMGSVYIRYVNADIVKHIDIDDTIDPDTVTTLKVDYDLITLTYKNGDTRVYKYTDTVYTQTPILKITEGEYVTHKYDYIARTYIITIKVDKGVMVFSYNVDSLVRTLIFDSSVDAEYIQYKSIAIDGHLYENLDTYNDYGDIDILMVRDISDRTQDPMGGPTEASPTFYNKVDNLIADYYTNYAILKADIKLIFDAGLLNATSRHDISESDLIELELESIEDNLPIGLVDDKVVITAIILQMCAIYAGFGVTINTFIEMIVDGVGIDSMFIPGSASTPSIEESSSYLYRIISVVQRDNLLIVGYQNRITFNVVYQSIIISEL